MEYLTRPYEVVPGQTDKVMKESADYLFEVFQKRPIRGRSGVCWRGTSFPAILRMHCGW